MFGLSLPHDCTKQTGVSNGAWISPSETLLPHDCNDLGHLVAYPNTFLTTLTGTYTVSLVAAFKKYGPNTSSSPHATPSTASRNRL